MPNDLAVTIGVSGLHDVPTWAAVMISAVIIAVAFWVRDGGIRS